jgi:lysophospholipase L1-like esterase
VSRIRALVAVASACLVLLAMLAGCGAADRSPSREVQAETTRHTDRPDPRLKVVFLGDSYVAGQGAKDQAKTRWTARVSQTLGWTEVNLGLGGTGYTTPGPADKATTFVQRVDAVKQASPDVVVVSGGRNDLLATVDRIRSTAGELFRKLKGLEGSPQVVVVAPLWDATKPPPELASATRAIKDAADEVGVEFVPVPDQPLDGRPALVAPDGLHPNADGYKVLAEFLAPRLRDVLGKR